MHELIDIKITNLICNRVIAQRFSYFFILLNDLMRLVITVFDNLCLYELVD